MSDAHAASVSNVETRAEVRPPRLRFSLSGIFVFVLGVAVALAYRRVPHVGWVDTVLAACACWVGVGMLQEVRNSWLFWRANWHLPRAVQWGFALALIRELAALLLMAAGWAFLLIRQTRSEGPGEEFLFGWVLANLAWTILLFGILLSYWPERGAAKADDDRRAARWGSVFDGVLVAMGGCWLLLLLPSQMTVVGLVHTAIRGVENYQPMRWLGEPLYPANFHEELTRQFAYRSVLAAALIATAGGSTVLMNRWWDRRGMRIVCAAAALGFAGGAAALAWWAGAVAYPVLSPFLAPQTFRQPAINWMAGLTLVVGAALACAWRLVPRPVPRPIEADAAAAEATPRETLHTWMPVMILLLIAMLSDFLRDRSLATFFNNLFGLKSQPLWQWMQPYVSGLLEAWVSDPRLTMQWAAALVVGWQVWHRWRGLENDWGGLVAVNPLQFLTVTALVAIGLVVAVPVAAWLGFVLVVYSPLLGL